MKKIYFYIFIFFLIILIPIKVLADDELVKNINNPIEITSEIQNWNEIAQRQPAILFESNIFKIWYASYNGTHFKIVYGESSDLKTISTKKLININYDSSYDFHDPSVIKVNNKYELYFAISKNETNYKILKAVSDDGINFENNPVEILNTNLTWNNKAVSAPFVYFENNKYYLVYTGWDGSEWKIGLAISNNGTDWENCTNNPIIAYASGPTLIKKQDKYVILFHSSNASNIESIETNDSLSCLSNWTNRKLVLTRDKDYDNKLITDPNIINLNDKFYLLYSGLSLTNKWTLNLAQNVKEDLNKYIVFIPGFMTSWNKNGLVYNLNTSIYDWKILDFVKEYDGIINTLKNENFELEKDLFIFAYDWRKPLEGLSEDLKTFIQDKILSKDTKANIYIVGHSFGGLVGRIYTQKHPDNIEKIITVGTPHKGTAQVYKAIQAGNVDSSNNYLSFAQNIVLSLNRNLYKTDKEIVHELFPSLLDIYPTYDFLYDENNNLISLTSLNIKNNTLQKYNNLEPLKIKLFSLYSDSYSAISGYKITQPSPLNAIFDRYIDGEPIETKYSSGDKNLISESTIAGENTIKITGDHEEIIYKKNNIKKILGQLEIIADDSEIVEGEKTVLNPSLIFIIKSPAVMEVILDNKSFYEEDGLIFIPNAASGHYKLKVQGIGNGKYTILIGQISQSNEIWEELKGEITNLIPVNQVDIFEIDYNSRKSESITNNSKTLSPSLTNAVSYTPSSNTPDSQSSSSNTTSSDKNNSSIDDTLVAQQNNANLQSEEVLGVFTDTKNKEKTKKILDVSKNNKKSENINMPSTLADVFLLIVGSIIYILRKNFFKRHGY